MNWKVSMDPTALQEEEEGEEVWDVHKTPCVPILLWQKKI